MELWSAYNCQELISCSSAAHIQVGHYQATKKDVSVRASDQSASVESNEREV